MHLKLGDYLRPDPQHKRTRIALDEDDERQWQRRFVQWCQAGDMDHLWQDTTSDQTEQERRLYDRQHYVSHLFEAQDWPQLFNVLDTGTFGQAKMRHDPSMRFSGDIMKKTGQHSQPIWENGPLREANPVLYRACRLSHCSERASVSPRSRCTSRMGGVPKRLLYSRLK